MKYTPGPWILGEDRGDPAVLDSMDKLYIAVMAIWPKGNVLDVDRANARLISAAPEMLETIEEFLRVTSGLYGTDIGEARLRARAIIAKAKGGA